MTEQPMNFSEALSQLIRRDMSGDSEWRLTVAGRIDAREALLKALGEEKGKSFRR